MNSIIKKAMVLITSIGLMNQCFTMQNDKLNKTKLETDNHFFFQKLPRPVRGMIYEFCSPQALYTLCRSSKAMNNEIYKAQEGNSKIGLTFDSIVLGLRSRQYNEAIEQLPNLFGPISGISLCCTRELNNEAHSLNKKSLEMLLLNDKIKRVELVNFNIVSEDLADVLRQSQTKGNLRSLLIAGTSITNEIAQILSENTKLRYLGIVPSDIGGNVENILLNCKTLKRFDCLHDMAILTYWNGDRFDIRVLLQILFALQRNEAVNYKEARLLFKYVYFVTENMQYHQDMITKYLPEDYAQKIPNALQILDVLNQQVYEKLVTHKKLLIEKFEDKKTEKKELYVKTTSGKMKYVNYYEGMLAKDFYQQIKYFYWENSGADYQKNFTIREDYPKNTVVIRGELFESNDIIEPFVSLEKHKIYYIINRIGGPYLIPYHTLPIIDNK